MAAQPLTAGLAPSIVCSGGYVVRLTALNPATGAVVSGVTVSGVSLQVEAADAETVPAAVAPAAPLFVYGPNR